MKILIVHNKYLNPGGEDEVVRSEAAMLTRFGHQVLRYERTNEELLNLSPSQKWQFISKDVLSSTKTYEDIRSLIQRERPDIAHIHNTFIVISPSVYQACREEGLPIVQTLHNYRFLCPNALFYRDGHVCEDCLTYGRNAALVHRCWRNSFILTAAVKNAVDEFYRKKILEEGIDHFIALSEFSRKKHAGNGIPSTRISVKPNFLENDPGQTDALGDYALFIGGLQDYKGVLTLIEAWKKLGGKYVLKMIGDGPLRERVEGSIKDETIEWLGQKSLADVIITIKKARCVILPSECYENFPRVIAESFACSVPVITSDIGAMKEIVQDESTGLHFHAGDSGDLARKIERLMKDIPLAQSLGQGARKEYEAKYTLQKNYDLLIGIYTEALQKRHSSGAKI